MNSRDISAIGAGYGVGRLIASIASILFFFVWMPFAPILGDRRGHAPAEMGEQEGWLTRASQWIGTAIWVSAPIFIVVQWQDGNPIAVAAVASLVYLASFWILARRLYVSKTYESLGAAGGVRALLKYPGLQAWVLAGLAATWISVGVGYWIEFPIETWGVAFSIAVLSFGTWATVRAHADDIAAGGALWETVTSALAVAAGGGVHSEELAQVMRWNGDQNLVISPAPAKLVLMSTTSDFHEKLATMLPGWEVDPSQSDDQRLVLQRLTAETANRRQSTAAFEGVVDDIDTTGLFGDTADTGPLSGTDTEPEIDFTFDLSGED